jgi:lipoprotein-releasing system permease protein
VYSVVVAWRYFKSSRRYLSITTLLSLFGMMLGVASLVVSMGVISGYETTLRKTVTDLIGHVTLVRTGAEDSDEEFIERLKKETPGFVSATAFTHLEGVLAHNKKLSGVLVEGVDPETWTSVMNLKPRLIRGQLAVHGSDGENYAVIAKGIAEKFALNPGDRFRLVFPKSDPYNEERLRPIVLKLQVAGVISLGRHDFDNRYVLVGRPTLQGLARGGLGVSGFRMRLEDENKAGEVSFKLSKTYGTQFWVKYWWDVNRNLFRAVELEKAILFFVLQIIVAAACFNIMGTLFVTVLKRYSDISILKAIGAPNRFILRVFSNLGLMIGCVGSLLGILLGLGLCLGFTYIQEIWTVMPAEVYKLDNVQVEVRSFDLMIIFAFSMLICFLSTLIPSRWGTKLTPTEGLHYE